jgi:hypothetical protein
MYKTFNRLERERTFRDEKLQHHYAHYVHEFFSPRYRPYPKHLNLTQSKDGEIEQYMDAAVEKEIIACEKSILIVESNELHAELRYLKQSYPQISFYVGNNSMELGLKRKMILNFENPGTSKAPFYLKVLLQAGIRDYVLSIQTHKNYLRRRTGTKLIQIEIPPTPVDMNGPTQTIFIILAVITSLAGFLFVLELVYFNRKILYESFIHLVTVSIVGGRRIFANICTSLNNKCLHLE